MKSVLIVTSILYIAAFASCGKPGSKNDAGAKARDPRMHGLWNADGDSFMRIEPNGTFSYLDSPNSKPTRVGTWEWSGDATIKYRFDWMDEIKRFPEREKEIREGIEREPQARIQEGAMSILLTGDGDGMITTNKSGSQTIWQRVK